MAQQGIKVRPVLLKRNSLDSVDFRRQPHHRRSKSQQVRFKDDGTDNPRVAESELEAGATQNTYALGKTQGPQAHNLAKDSLYVLPSHKGLQNIAIQTSPSLRKHFPLFKKKRITTSKSLTEMPKDSEFSIQFNGNLSDQNVISSSLSYLSINQHLDDGPRTLATSPNLLFQRLPKAQYNGPVHLDSATFAILEKTTVSTQMPEYVHLGSAQDNFSIYGPDTQMDLNTSVHSSAFMRQSNENCSVHTGSEKSLSGISSNCNKTNMDHISCEEKNYSELHASNDDTSTKEAILSSPLHRSSSYCSLREHQQPIQQKANSNHKTLTNNNQTMSFTNNNASPVPSCQTATQPISANTEVPQNDYLENFHINTYLPGTEIKPQNKEIKEINPIHLAHRELCALKDRLQSVEESLQSNQEKIKVLLNVIQDLEKARALNEGYGVF